MKIYISGPMTHYPELNFPEFNRVAKILREAGYDVINPAETDQSNANNWCGYMKNALREMMDCDTILMLDGWLSSKGACIELELADDLGYANYDLKEFSDIFNINLMK